jgi:hypothetical protein
MSSLVIVAIPAEDDYVNKISSEKIPHMTLLFLGEDADKVKNFNNILGFTQHAANQSLMRFGLEVDRRGVLGDELADVLFFSKSKWSGFELINNFRSYLLKNDNIRTAYDSAEQFPEWIPHLTLGTPDSPAKPDERDYPGINYVNFDRVAVWFGEYEGIEFPLKTYDWDSEVAMGNNTVDQVVDNILAHHGVKGQKWGVRRKATVGPREVIVRDSRLSRVTKRAKTSGGEGHPTHEDAIRALKTGQVSKKSGFKALSNEELQAYTQRLNLEQNAKRLRYQDSTAAKKFVYTLLGQTGKGAAQSVANDASGQLVKKHLYKKIGLAAAAAA